MNPKDGWVAWLLVRWHISEDTAENRGEDVGILGCHVIFPTTLMRCVSYVGSLVRNVGTMIVTRLGRSKIREPYIWEFTWNRLLPSV
jgi:hypothetical protein